MANVTIEHAHSLTAAEAKTRVELRLVAAGEKVSGSWVSWPEPGVELVQPLEYLQLTKDGLAFGMINGMRPRGVLVHDGKREGDTMRGEENFGGIRFTPHGHVYFELHHRP